MAIITCPECEKSVSSEAPGCPACGYPIKPPPMPEKKTGLWWGLGCLLAIPALFMVVAFVGLLAAIAIPSFVKAREASQRHACINNMRQIVSAKQAWALTAHADKDTQADASAVNEFLKNAAHPTCLVGGTYKYGAVNRNPECSKHGVLGAPPSSGHSSRTTR